MKIAIVCGQIVLIGCLKCGQRGRGVQNPKIYADVLNGSPYQAEAAKINVEKEETVETARSCEEVLNKLPGEN